MGQHEGFKGLSDTIREFLFYNSEDGSVKVQVLIDAKTETIWATQKAMAALFGVQVAAISKHIKHVIDEGELDAGVVVSKMEITTPHGAMRGKTQTQEVSFYSLDMIISVGYRISSSRATQFRIWATKVLKEYMVKGFALDDERLKNGGNVLGKEYFDELLERVQEIRASERLFYQKITDIFAESVDYDPKSPLCKDFYASVQNKLEYAVTGKTSAEIIVSRADASHPTMGLLTWKAAKRGGKIQLSDTLVAKNYMTRDELGELTTLVNLCLDSAALTVRRGRPIYMAEWVDQVNAQLRLHGYDLLPGKGVVSRKQAEETAAVAYEAFRPIQDARFKSDFDKLVEKTLGK